MGALSDADAFRDFERAAQNRGAASYANFFDPITAHAVDDLLDAAAVASGTRVLDVACGPGGTAGRAASRGALVTGMDLAPEMLAHARQRYPGVQFKEGDAEALPFEDESFHAITCNFGVGHFPRPERAAAEFSRVACVNACVAISWWAFPDAKVNGTFFDAIAESGITAPATLPAGPPVTRYADPTALESLLRNAGFADVHVLQKRWNVTVSDIEFWWRGGMESLVRAAVTILAQPPAGQEFVKRTFARLAERFRGDDRFHVPMAAWIASGRKRADSHTTP